MLSGKRMEMDFRLGLSLGKAVDFAFSQSRNSVESRSDQKARSSSSFLNDGIFFFLAFSANNLPTFLAVSLFPTSLSSKELQDAANHWTRPIFSKDVGCYLSHRKAWEEVSKRDNKCLILEDDVIISKEIKNVINLVDNLKDSWNTVYDLEYAPGYHVLSKQTFYSGHDNLFNIREIYRNKTGLAAYILGPQIALKMLEELKNYVMVDAAFWSRSWAQYMQVEPAPVMQIMHLGKETKQDENSIKGVRNINFINKSWFSRKFKRLQISLFTFEY